MILRPLFVGLTSACAEQSRNELESKSCSHYFMVNTSLNDGIYTCSIVIGSTLMIIHSNLIKTIANKCWYTCWVYLFSFTRRSKQKDIVDRILYNTTITNCVLIYSLLNVEFTKYIYFWWYRTDGFMFLIDILTVICTRRLYCWFLKNDVTSQSQSNPWSHMWIP